MTHSENSREYDCKVCHLEAYVGYATVTASSPQEALAKLREQVDEGEVYFQDYIESEQPYEFSVEGEDGTLTQAEPDNNLHAQRHIAAALLEALEAQAMADADPEASRRKGYFEQARELRRAALKLAGRAVW